MFEENVVVADAYVRIDRRQRDAARDGGRFQGGGLEDFDVKRSAERLLVCHSISIPSVRAYTPLSSLASRFRIEGGFTTLSWVSQVWAGWLLFLYGIGVRSTFGISKKCSMSTSIYGLPELSLRNGNALHLSHAFGIKVRHDVLSTSLIDRDR